MGVKADITALGKALSGGLYPASCALADSPVMSVMTPESHGSTFGGNPLACRVVIAALDALFEEKMVENAEEQGIYFREVLSKEFENSEKVVEFRGMGLFNGVEMRP